MEILKRILSILVFVIAFPFSIIGMFLLPILGVIALGKYIINGDNLDELFDFIFDKISVFIFIPFNITDKIFKNYNHGK